MAGFKLNFGKDRRRDRGRRDAGNMSSALDELELNDVGPGAPGQNAKTKREPVNRTHFVIEFVWTPDKPQPKPGSSTGSLAGATASAAGATGGTASSPGGRPAASTTAPKK